MTVTLLIRKSMQIFIKDLDYELWDIISKGDIMPTVKERDKTISKPKSDFSKEKTKKVVKKL